MTDRSYSEVIAYYRATVKESVDVQDENFGLIEINHIEDTELPPQFLACGIDDDNDIFLSVPGDCDVAYLTKDAAAALNYALYKLLNKQRELEVGYIQ